MSKVITIRKGDYVRKQNKLYKVTLVYPQGSRSSRPMVDFTPSVIKGRRIVGRDVNGDEHVITGILVSSHPDTINLSADINDTVLIFTAQSALDLICDGDLLSIKLGDYRIVEYVKDIPFFENLFKDGGKYKVIDKVITKDLNGRDYTEQWSGTYQELFKDQRQQNET